MRTAAVSSPVTVRTAVPTEAGTLASPSGAMATAPVGVRKSASRTAKALSAALTGPVTAT